MSKVIKFIKANLFVTVIAAAYLVLSSISPSIGGLGVKNSLYYIKEMFMIMPVIFVLTALLDTWVSKETITKFLGKEAKAKGVMFSFLLGSISAGPIYAAFPICTMLHKKGVPIRNIVIILSSWAVVKIPMLLNEAKFLGFKFMIARWVLTVLAITIFATITDKLVKDRDLPQFASVKNSGVSINRESCMGCTICTKTYPKMFSMESKKAILNQHDEVDMTLLKIAIKACPVMAIEFS